MKENRTLEFKESISNSFLKTVSAFANFQSGEICFGTQDDGQILGLKDPAAACLAIENKINDAIKPKPNFTLHIRPDQVVSLQVFEGLHKPYLYKGKAYQRSDTSTVEVDQVELKRLILTGENRYFEELPAPQQSLTFHRLEEEFATKLEITTLNDDIFKTLGFLTEDKQWNRAAEIFADQNTCPGVDIMRFGSSINTILERQTFTHISILKLFDETLAMFVRNYLYEEIEGSERKQRELIPKEAFREALANALVHRTWDVKQHVRIAMSPKEITIQSPGGLPAGVSEEEYKNGYVSALRNPIIANVLFRLHYIEIFGTGIKRIKDTYAGHPVRPQFTVTPNQVSVTLPSLTAKLHLSPPEKEIYQLLNQGLLLSRREIEEKTGLNKSQTLKTIKHLLAQNLIQVEGQGRATKYRIL